MPKELCDLGKSQGKLELKGRQTDLEDFVSSARGSDYRSHLPLLSWSLQAASLLKA